MLAGYGRRLIEIRLDSGLNQDEFADKLGVHKRSVGGYEKEQHLPSIKYIASLIEVFHVNAHWVVTGQGEKYFDPKKSGGPKYQIMDLEERVAKLEEEIAHLMKKGE